MRRRHTLITWFVIGWTLLFQYETLRAHYLSPLVLRLRSARALSGVEGLAGRPLPKMALLFPPAGWIMFFRVEPDYGFAAVHGIRRGQPIALDPHAIFATRAIGYDNIRRNVLVGVLTRETAGPFCGYLHRKFPAYDRFHVFSGAYPDLLNAPDRVVYELAYQCGPYPADGS